MVVLLASRQHPRNKKAAPRAKPTSNVQASAFCSIDVREILRHARSHRLPCAQKTSQKTQRLVGCLVETPWTLRETPVFFSETPKLVKGSQGTSNNTCRWAGPTLGEDGLLFRKFGEGDERSAAKDRSTPQRLESDTCSARLVQSLAYLPQKSNHPDNLLL